MEGCVRRAGMLALFGVLAAASSAGAQGQGGRNAAPQPAGAGQAAMALKSIDPDGRRMEQLLQLWSRTSTELKTLEVKITKIDEINPAWGKPETFEGRALFKAPNLAWVDYKREVVNAQKQKALVDDERIIWTGAEVWQYRSPNKQVFIYTLDQQESHWPIPEVPLPFLFNFRADEAGKRYDMVLSSETKNTYVVKVTPREEIDKQSFSLAQVRLSYVQSENQAARPQLLPTTIVLYHPGGANRRVVYHLSDLKPDVAVADENFQGRRPGPPWQVHVFNPKDLKALAELLGFQCAGMPAAGDRPARRQPR